MRVKASDIDIEFLGEVGKDRTLEDYVKEIEEHRWKLEHRANIFDDLLEGKLLRDELLSALRAEMRAALGEMRRATALIYGALGASFERTVVLPHEGSDIVHRFGMDEAMRRSRSDAGSLENTASSQLPTNAFEHAPDPESVEN